MVAPILLSTERHTSERVGILSAQWDMQEERLI
jgi:hypothetical protein